MTLKRALIIADTLRDPTPEFTREGPDYPLVCQVLAREVRRQAGGKAPSSVSGDTRWRLPEQEPPPPDTPVEVISVFRESHIAKYSTAHNHWTVSGRGKRSVKIMVRYWRPL